MNTTPEVRLGAIYRETGPHQSGKVRRNFAVKLAGHIALQVGMVPTWPNVQCIRLAIESESLYSAISVNHAAALIVTAALEITRARHDFLSSWDQRQLSRQNDIDRFWFEDARWRSKESYWLQLERLRAAEAS